MLNLKNINHTILVPVVLLAILIIYFIGRSYGKNAAKVKEEKELDKEIDKNKLTYPLISYKHMADALESAMQTSGTDEQTIFRIFEKLKTQSDLLQLIKSFGSRKNYWFGVPLYEHNLPFWLKDELSSSEIEKLYAILKKNNLILVI